MVIDIFMRNDNRRYDACATYDLDTKETIVKKGSRVSESISSAKSFKGANAIKTKRELFVINGVVTTDVVFKSASTAGNFVTGHSTNGMSAWKDEKGFFLKRIIQDER